MNTIQQQPPVPAGGWRKASYSDDQGGECVEVVGGLTTGPIGVRDTKNRAVALMFGPAAAAGLHRLLASGAVDPRA